MVDASTTGNREPHENLVKFLKTEMKFQEVDPLMIGFVFVYNQGR